MNDKYSIYVDGNSRGSGGIHATEINGASLRELVLTGEHKNVVFDFDATMTEYVQFSLWVPEQWNEKSLTFQVLWTINSKKPSGVSWALQAVSTNDAHPIEYGEATVIEAATHQSSNILHVTQESEAVIVAGDFTSDNAIHFQLFRVVGSANDTALEDATLIAVRTFWDAKE